MHRKGFFLSVKRVVVLLRDYHYTITLKQLQLTLGKKKEKKKKKILFPERLEHKTAVV